MESGQNLLLQKAVQSELRNLRGMLKVISQRLVFRLEGQIESLSRELSEEKLSDAFAGLSPLQAGKSLKAILNLIKALRVIPERGRRKDLKRIENLLESVSWILDHSAPAWGKAPGRKLKPPESKPPLLIKAAP